MKHERGFWANLKGIIVNLPLVLSDTKDPRDVSLNRVSSFFGFVIAAFVLYEAIYVYPQYMNMLFQFFATVMAYLSAQMAGNIYKKTKQEEYSSRNQSEIININHNNIPPTSQINNILDKLRNGQQGNIQPQQPPNYVQQDRPPIPIHNMPNIPSSGSNVIDRSKD